MKLSERLVSAWLGLALATCLIFRFVLEDRKSGPWVIAAFLGTVVSIEVLRQGITVRGLLIVTAIFAFLLAWVSALSPYRRNVALSSSSGSAGPYSGYGALILVWDFDVRQAVWITYAYIGGVCALEGFKNGITVRRMLLVMATFAFLSGVAAVITRS